MFWLIDANLSVGQTPAVIVYFNSHLSLALKVELATKPALEHRPVLSLILFFL